ncbi:MarR family winged helix-turn-helix transcriptional regulator [Martelella radicis]|uniref:DNA-binding MarR family transcriptional regulator n=1 Tax=Martelella radicis TaxID=1397476 RepID=A0A7W6PB42_9HYPH|nr:MarR family transcriptional regulator [Martelella radicis]MBB4122052.1 DNA-binding MarR family transcriptional regulator [Martelella radicis]
MLDQNDDTTAHLDGIGPEDGDIRHLFSYNLQRLAGMSSRIASLALERDFGVTVQEWRTLAVLDFLDAAPLHLLAQRAGVQKSQMSRLINDLEERDMVAREQHPRDKRSVVLQLTPEAKDLVKRILKKSRERNEHMLRELSQDERQSLMRLIGKITTATAETLDHYKQESDDSLPRSYASASLYLPE